eukprot:m.17475 g.17475  ORF g.17475 m.17475 type:complete len:463 (-) comp9553_c0_seq2:31-1419(-)
MLLQALTSLLLLFVAGSLAVPPRGSVLAGFGNELVFQPMNNTVLPVQVARSGSAVARYPGGTPANYWFWSDGWIRNSSWPTFRLFNRAPPALWARYTQQTAEATIFDVNVYSANHSYTLQGLQAFAAQGVDIRFVELGNELYDVSHNEYTDKWPVPADYAVAMQPLTAAIKTLFPQAQVALVGVRYDDPQYQSERSRVWNAQVLQNAVSKQADAATLHIYLGLPAAAPTVADQLATLNSVFVRVQENHVWVNSTIPQRFALWVTELGVFCGDKTQPFVLERTWLQSLVYASAVLLLWEIPRVHITTPYCLVCGDPTAPAFFPDNSSAPHTTAWSVSPVGAVLQRVFQAVQGNTQMQQIVFPSQPASSNNATGAWLLRPWLGWFVQPQRRAVLLRLDPTPAASPDLSALLPALNASAAYTCWMPSPGHSIVEQGTPSLPVQVHSGRLARGTFSVPAWALCVVG